MSEIVNGQGSGGDAALAQKAARRADRRKRIDRAQRKMLERMSDRQIENTIGTALGMKLLFRSFENLYSAEKVGDFRGEIEFTLGVRKGREAVWTLAFLDNCADARVGASRDPKLRLSSPLAEFLRIGSGLTDAGPALTEGRLVLEGDFTALALLIELLAGGAL